MSFKKSWSVDDVSNQIRALARETASPYNDGFTGWYIKQDLYQIKFVIDEALRQSPTFGDIEERWLTEQEQKRIIKILKN